MVEVRDELVEEVLELFHSLSRAVHHNAAPVLMETDLTMAQLRTLVILMKEGPATIGHLAVVQQISLPTASHLVDRLVQAQLAERAVDPADRRRTLAKLSPSGEELIVRLRQGPQEQFHQLLARIAPDDLAALNRGLRALVQAADEEFGCGEHGARC